MKDKADNVIEYIKQSEALPDIKIIWQIHGNEVLELMSTYNCGSMYELTQLLLGWLDKEIPAGRVYAHVNDTVTGEKLSLMAANTPCKPYSDELDKVREENKMLRLQMFAFVRNAAVLPVGRRLNKSEQEITDKTFETIEAARAMLDVEAVKSLMNLATNKQNRFNTGD